MKHDLTSGDPISVSDYISFINELLSRLSARLIGETSEVKMAASGHVYFSLKDEKTGDVLNCAIWSSIYRMCGITIEDGMKVIVTGNPDVYRARGTLTFKVKTIELVGEGALKKAYDKLKKKLFDEGLFDEERKRPIPRFPKKIGVITSTKGAAIHDFTSNLGRFGFKVYSCDTRVEGQEAVPDLLSSLNVMKRKDLDVLVIMRGGGSLQSLQAFDNEMLVREIVNFPVPVIAGIGHHQDITLTALAADKTESTPTATATILNRGFEKARESFLFFKKSIKTSYENLVYRKKRKLSSFALRITGFFRSILEEHRKSEEKLKRSVSVMTYSFRNRKEKIESFRKKIENSFLLDMRKIDQQRREFAPHLFSLFFADMDRASQKIDDFSRIVSISDPKKQLSMGYAILHKKGKVVKSVQEVKKDDKIDIDLSDGVVFSEVKNVKKKKYE